MATSGTNVFNMDIEEVISQAFDLVGRDYHSATDLKKARTTLNLIFIQLLNRGIPLWKTEEIFVTTSTSQRDYTLDSNILDVLDGHIQVSSGGNLIDLPMERIGIFQYSDIPVKNQPGRPTQFTVDRFRDNKIVRVWLTPADIQYVMKFWVIKKVEDAGAYPNTMDIEFRYIPAIISWLAYELAKKNKEILMSEGGQALIARLEKDYKEQLMLAEDADGERGSFYVSPTVYDGR